MRSSFPPAGSAPTDVIRHSPDYQGSASTIGYGLVRGQSLYCHIAIGITRSIIRAGKTARLFNAYVLAPIADHPAKRITELLPWNWKAAQAKAA